MNANGQSEIKSSPALPQMSKSDRQKIGKALFVRKDDLDAKISKLEDELEALKGQRQKLAKEVVETLGQGPFTWKGEKVILMRRTDKETGDVTHFFRGEGEQTSEAFG
jgi:hypothetical protein